MAHYHWSELFPPHIWLRGQNYYQDGRVLDIRRSGGCITAEVEGSELYNVSVDLDAKTGRIEAFFCDCPYGEDGTPCKHLAALLCALEDTDGSAAETETPPAYEQTVELLTTDQMRQLLIQLAQNDPYIWEKIQLTATNKLPKTQKRQWECDLQKLSDEAADRHGSISYGEAYDYCCSLADYLYDRTTDLLHSGLITDAFDLVCLVFQTGLAQDLDDSDGGLGMLADSCMDEWNKILDQATPEQQADMFHWFCTEYQTDDLARTFLCDHIFTARWKPEIVPELMDLLDKQIELCVNGEESDYRLDSLVVHRIHWMEWTGAPCAEQSSYLQKYHQLPAVREIELIRLKHNGDWAAAISLLEESKEIDADKPGLVAQYSRQLIEIYEAHSDHGAMLKELEYYLFTFWQDDLTYVEKLKALLSPVEWETMRCRLLESRSMRGQVYPLLYQEGMYEQLMAQIEARADIHALERYESMVKKNFPQRGTALYEAYLYQAMRHASDRKAYRSVIQILKKLKKYPDGKAAAQTIAQSWKETYPRRTSMLDELTKAGF